MKTFRIDGLQNSLCLYIEFTTLRSGEKKTCSNEYKFLELKLYKKEMIAGILPLGADRPLPASGSHLPLWMFLSLASFRRAISTTLLSLSPSTSTSTSTFLVIDY